MEIIKTQCPFCEEGIIKTIYRPRTLQFSTTTSGNSLSDRGKRQVRDGAECVDDTFQPRGAVADAESDVCTFEFGLMPLPRLKVTISFLRNMW